MPKERGRKRRRRTGKKEREDNDSVLSPRSSPSRPVAPSKKPDADAVALALEDILQIQALKHRMLSESAKLS